MKEEKRGKGRAGREIKERKERKEEGGRKVLVCSKQAY